MDRKLLDILVCPVTRQSLALADAATVAALNAAIAEGRALRTDGSMQTESVHAALLTHDGKRAYRVDDGIPVLLAEEAIAMDGIATTTP